MKLTLPQQDVYFDQLLYPNEPIYNIGAKIEIKGNLNIELLKESYIVLIDQHDAYRSVLVKNQEDVTLALLEKHSSELGFIDFSNCQNPIEEATIYMQKEFLKPFDLINGNLLHIFTLVKVEENFHYLFSVYHHIITDGWGTSLMFQRLVQNYNEIYAYGNVKTLYPFSYQDFIIDDEEYQNSAFFLEDKRYWVTKFNSLPENLFDKINETTQITGSNRKVLVIKREIYNKLDQFAASYKCSVFHLILAVLYTYFGRKHQNNDFAIGVPVLNRTKSKYKKTVGLFMGVSPLRTTLDFDASFEDLIIDIKNQLRHDYRHQRFPLGKLIQELRIFNEKEKLFNITLSYEKQNYSTDFQHTQTKVIPLTHQSERVALAIYIREFDELEDVKIDFDYNLNYFNNLGITKVVHHFENIINDFLIHPDKKLKEVCYLSEAEERQVLVEFNDTNTDFSDDKTFIDLFEAQVEKSPDFEAVRDGFRSYSYSELSILSNKIAEYIITAYGKHDKSPIAILLERSAVMVPVILGILKSGRSYIPLDPAFPKERLNYIINDSQSKLIITNNSYELEDTGDTAILIIENVMEEIDQLQGVLFTSLSSEDTAYIIYTSGSTGNPKGVEIGHQSLLNFLCSIQEKPGISSKDILLSVTTYSFDISILEFFAPLVSGATLYIVTQEVLSDPNLIILKIEEVQPTVIQATPSFYQMLFNAGWSGNKGLKVLCGGDLLSEVLAEKLLNYSSEVWNMYGPTETTIWSSMKKIEHFKDASNVGKPLNNTQFYILDDFFKPKPIGTSGAIYISGHGLAKGYYKNEKLTREKFTKNPFDDRSLLYETGDVGKWNEKGEIEFLGRNDNQVKIRGYRIELGDIESQLNQIKGVQDSVVIAKKGDQQEAFLVAYILKKIEGADINKIWTSLKMNLPYYMIPNTIIPLEEFPLTLNQKVDRKFLSQRAIQQNISDDDFKGPISDLEKKISEYWKEVLNIKELIGLNDNFFALGGHSLNAVRLIGLISTQLSLNITLKTIFDYPTIKLLASYLQELKPVQKFSIPLAESKHFYSLTPTQFNVWLASQHRNCSIAYNMSAGYNIEGIVNVDRIKESISKIINKHEILRTNFIEVDGLPHQRVNPFDKVDFEISVSNVKGEMQEETINQLINTAFDLEKDLLIRVKLLQLELNKFILLFSTHHIIMDGVSLEIFINEFIENYNEGTSLDTSKINSLGLQFKDYSEWFNKSLSDNAVRNVAFWKNYLRNYQSKDSFDKDFNGEQNQQRSDKCLFELTVNTTLALKKLALEEQVTFYTILVTSLNILIYRLSNHSDICIGTVDSGRNISELNDQIGMFVKTLILRTQIESEQTFIDILKSIKNNLFEINAYQDVPFDKVSQSTFDTLLVYQSTESYFGGINELHDLNLITYPVYNKYSKMPMVFNLYESDNCLKGIIGYNCDLFEKDTIQIIALSYTKILDEIVKNPLMEVGLIDTRIEFENDTTFDFDFNF